MRDLNPSLSVIWILASTVECIELALRGIARKRRLPGWESPAADPLGLVSEWLSSFGSWLLLLDNTDETNVFFGSQPRTGLSNRQYQSTGLPMIEHLLRTMQGRVLITSRSRNTSFRLINDAENIMDIPCLSEDESVALLSRMLPRNHATEEDKKVLVQLLGYLPLAISQAASHISMRRTDFDMPRYCDLLRNNTHILGDDMGDLRRDSTVSRSIVKTCQIHFNQMKQENNDAANLMSVMSVLDRQRVPRYLLSTLNKGYGLEKGLALLEDYSFITSTDGQNFYMHKFIHTAVRTWLSENDELDLLKQLALEYLSYELGTASFGDWTVWKKMLPHVEVVLQYNFIGDQNQVDLASLLHETANYLWVRGAYDTALERVERALCIASAVLGEDSEHTARSLVLQAKILSNTCNKSKAEAELRKASAVFERVLGASDERTASVCDGLVDALLRYNP